MQELIHYVRHNFARRENGLIQLLLLNALAFVLLLCAQIVQRLTGFPGYALLCYYTQLPASWWGWLWRCWTLVSYGFVHLSLGRLAFNMLYLYSFGSIVTYLLGSKQLVRLYVLGTVVGGLAFLLAGALLPQQALLRVAMGYPLCLAGAGPALYAVLAGAVAFAPQFPVAFVPSFTLRLKHVLLLFLAWPLWQLAQEDALTSVALLSATLAGYLYVRQLQRGQLTWLHRGLGKLQSWVDRRRGRGGAKQL